MPSDTNVQQDAGVGSENLSQDNATSPPAVGPQGGTQHPPDIPMAVSSLTSSTNAGVKVKATINPHRTLVLCFDGTGNKFGEVYSFIFSALGITDDTIHQQNVGNKLCQALLRLDLP